MMPIFVGSIDNHSIAVAEQILGQTFSSDYRLFLNKYGCGDIFGVEIFGIISDPISDGNGLPNVVWLTKELRKEGLPGYLIPVAEDGEGNYYVIDVSMSNRNKEGIDECPVLLFQSPSEKIIHLYDYFGSFLHKILSEMF
jgi:hypothetical protein